MAFLICYKKKDVEFDWVDDAIYLDQEFYELIFCGPVAAGSILEKISKLTYKDDLEIKNSELERLRKELVELDKKVSHEQIKGFIDIVETSYKTGDSLMVGGDMYPELAYGSVDSPAVSQRNGDCKPFSVNAHDGYR